MTVELEAPDL